MTTIDLEETPHYLYRKPGETRFVDLHGLPRYIGDVPPTGYKFVRRCKFLNSDGEFEIWEHEESK